MSTARAQLAERLRALRRGTGLSGNQLAQRLGWAQPRVSRLETGKQLPTEDDLAAWGEAVGADASVIEELRELRARATAEYATWKDSFRVARATGKQASILEIEARATRIGEFQPALVPGLLQTAAYAREMLSLPCGPLRFGSDQDDLEGMIAKRMERQRILYDPHKQVQLVMLEAALRARVCSTDTLAGQLDRLIAVAGLASVELGIIPFEADLPVWPIASFMIYDRDLVVAETITGEQRLSDPNEVAAYDEFFGLLRNNAASGQDAVTVIQRALAEVRSER